MNKEELNDIVCQSSSDYEILDNAYDYIEKLEQENKSLQSQLKEKEETMNKLKEWLDQEYEDCNKIGTPAIGYAMGQIRRVKTKIQELEILSKGENK
nr:MAG TPA: MAD PROTEIN/MAX PROTEIN/DNA factor, DNA, bHLHZ, TRANSCRIPTION-DNA.0A [Caudoviricetes sp.]